MKTYRNRGLTRRQLVRASAIAALGTSGAMAVTEPARANSATNTELDGITGAYTQVTTDGRYTGRGVGGAQYALLGLAVIHRVTRDTGHKALLDELIDFVLARNPSHMNSLLGIFTLTDDYLRSHDALRANVDAYATALIDLFASDPARLLHQGVIRELADTSNFLLTYAKFIEREAVNNTGPGREHRVHEVRRADHVARAMLDRLVELQFRYTDARDRYGNPRLTGCFPHNVDDGRGNMGSWEVSTWAFPMLSIDQSPSVRALADGFGRYRSARYARAAAAGFRPFLATTRIEPDLIYSGEPPGFPLDGAEFVIDDEGGEFPYLVTYGWSPNGIGDLAWAVRSLLDNRVVVPRSVGWAREYWWGSPHEAVLDPDRFRAGLREKLRFAHDFLAATQLPVPLTFPWMDEPRSRFPGTGDDDVRRGGWYDGSGRGEMSVWYTQIALRGYVASGGDDVGMLSRAAQWWERLIVRQPTS